jgi:hypothetical protein
MPANDETRVEELPPDETGPVPITHVEAEPHWYGISPRGGAVAVGVAAAGVGVVLLVLGSIVAGAVLLAVGALILAVLVRGPVASALSGPTARGRTALSIRLSAGQRLAALRRELDAIARERDERLRALGEAVFRGDDDAVEPLRRDLEDLDRRAAEAREEIDRTVLDARERISSTRLETARTQAVSSSRRAHPKGPRTNNNSSFR